MKRWQLLPLQRLREHRVQAAERVLAQARREVALAREAVSRVEREIDVLESNYRHLQQQPLETRSARNLQSREQRLEAARRALDAAGQRLLRTREQVTAAQAQEAVARGELNAARRKTESLQVQHRAWKRQQGVAEALDEEAELEDRVLADRAREPQT